MPLSDFPADQVQLLQQCELLRRHSHAPPRAHEQCSRQRAEETAPDHRPTSACGGSGNRSGRMRYGGMPVSAETRPTRSAGTRPRDFHLETEL